MEKWQENKDKIERIKDRMLGWDVSDFGGNDFAHCGAVLFTVRNGDKNDKEYKAPYAEKSKGYLIVGEVSKVNDDCNDNVFLTPSERFIPVEEDAAIIHSLANEYDKIV